MLLNLTAYSQSLIINNKDTYKFSEGFGITIPPNTYHWIKNTSKTEKGLIKYTNRHIPHWINTN